MGAWQTLLHTPIVYSEWLPKNNCKVWANAHDVASKIREGGDTAWRQNKNSLKISRARQGRRHVREKSGTSRGPGLASGRRRVRLQYHRQKPRHALAVTYVRGLVPPSNNVGVEMSGFWHLKNILERDEKWLFFVWKEVSRIEIFCHAKT